MGSQLKSDFTLMNENKLYQIHSKEKNIAFDALNVLGKKAIVFFLFKIIFSRKNKHREACSKSAFHNHPQP